MALKDLLGDTYKDGMTVDEIETALADKKLADLSNGEYISKGKYIDLDKRYKEIEGKLREKMTAEEQQAQALVEKEQHYKDLERKFNLSEFNNKLSKTIQDEKVRNEIAELLVDGKTFEAIEKQNAYQLSYKETLTKQIKEELLTRNPIPTPDNGNNGTVSKDQFKKMTVEERTKIFNEQPELYKTLNEN